VEITIECNELATRFQRQPLHLRPCRRSADTSPTLPTLHDVGYIPEIKMAATKPEVEITCERSVMKPWLQLLPPYFRPCPTRI
jgi:hypothetical protein